MEVSTAPKFPTAAEKGLKPWQLVKINGNWTVSESAIAATGKPVLATIMVAEGFVVLVAVDGIEQEPAIGRIVYPTNVEVVADALYPNWLPFRYWQHYAASYMIAPRAYDLKLTTGQSVPNCFAKPLHNGIWFLELGHPYRRFLECQVAAVRPTSVLK